MDVAATFFMDMTGSEEKATRLDHGHDARDNVGMDAIPVSLFAPLPTFRAPVRPPVAFSSALKALTIETLSCTREGA